MSLLGHRFIPQEGNRKRIAKEVGIEIDETLRKVGWKRQLAHLQTDDNPKVFVRKGTPIHERLMMELRKSTEGVALLTVTDVFDHLNVKSPGYTQKRNWMKLLNSLNGSGHFLSCDKNLGMRWVDCDTYHRLAEREARNYSARVDIDVASKQNELILYFKQEMQNILTITRIHRRSFDLNSKEDLYLKSVAGLIQFSSQKEDDAYHLPMLKLLLKVHKPLKDGLWQTRPIIPTFGLPSYETARWCGELLAKFARLIPYVLESSDQLLSWLNVQSRSPQVATFDFTNLYGNEPVRESILLLREAIRDLPYQFQKDSDDDIIWRAVTAPVDTPIALENIISGRAQFIVVVAAFVVKETIAALDIGDHVAIVGTDSFLAMGSSPVAPISNIILAYLEFKQHGREKCESGMRRLIDDIIVDHNIITELDLRKAYPSYLTLNDSSDGHFLDVSFAYNGSGFDTWIYVKPFGVIPLNFNSCHPRHILIATARNELRRIMGRTSLKEARPAWAEYWFQKYTAADYPENVLSSMLLEFCTGTKTIKARNFDKRAHIHIEKWRGTRSHTDRHLSERLKEKTVTAWSVGQSLQSLAFNATNRRKLH